MIGESFRLSRQTDGFFLPGPGTIKKQKRDGPAIGKPTYRPPAPPKTEIESAVKRPLLCAQFFWLNRSASKINTQCVMPCMFSSSELWELQQHPRLWHSRAGRACQAEAIWRVCATPSCGR